MDKTKVTAWIFAGQAGRLAGLSKKYREEQTATRKALIRKGKEPREARILIARMREEHWPSLESVVAQAIGLRLAEEDLSGPWEPLTAHELDLLALSGRWPGPSIHGLVQRNYALPSDLVLSLRTAAWRVSEPYLTELGRRGLVGAGLKLTEQQREHRDQLAAPLHSPARIIRQALSRYGPQPKQAPPSE